jgi:hypothetical protein
MDNNDDYAITGDILRTAKGITNATMVTKTKMVPKVTVVTIYHHICSQNHD